MNTSKKSAQRLFSGLAGREVSAPADKSQAAFRAEKFRDSQPPEFKSAEAARKRQERREVREKRERESREAHERKQLAEHLKYYRPLTAGQKTVPLDQIKLRPKKEDWTGMFMQGAPSSKGKLVSGGYDTQKTELMLGVRTADGTMSGLPRRAQLSDLELQKKLSDAAVSLEEKMESILGRWQQDTEFCAWIKELSLDDLVQFIQHCSQDVEYARQLLYEHTEHQACASPLTHAQPHGRRVQPNGHASDEAGEEHSKEFENTYARKINFKRRDTETLLIGGRRAKFYNLNGKAEDLFASFVQQNSFTPNEPTGELDDGEVEMSEEAPMVCKLCQSEIAPWFSVEEAFEHFGAEHRQLVIDAIRWHEAKAWRPKARNCAANHAKLAEKHGQGIEKLYCGGCKKLLYKPVKMKKPEKRSDAVKSGSAQQYAQPPKPQPIDKNRFAPPLWLSMPEEIPATL